MRWTFPQAVMSPVERKLHLNLSRKSFIQQSRICPPFRAVDFSRRSVSRSNWRIKEMANEEEEIRQTEEKLNVMAIDLCEHVTAMIRNAPCTRVTSVQTRANGTLLDRDDEIDFIVIGAPKFPVRRPFISQLREAYADVPILILRRVEVKDGDGISEISKFPNSQISKSK